LPTFASGFSIPIPAIDHVFSGFDYLGVILVTAIPFGIYDLVEALDNVDPDPRLRPSGEAIASALNVQLLAVPEARRRATAYVNTSFGEPAFVGREREFLALNRALDRAHAGQISIVHVEGQAGTGKSALLRQFLKATSKLEHTLPLFGRCSEREDVPYRALDGAVDTLAEALTRSDLPERATILAEYGACLSEAFPVLGRVVRAAGISPKAESSVPDVRRIRLSRALGALLSSLRTRRVVVLALDDMQWADQESLTLLSDIKRSPGAPAVLIVTASRPSRIGWDAETLELGNLPDRESVALAGELLFRAGIEEPRAEGLARKLACDASGHPLFIEQLVREVTCSPDSLALPKLDVVLWSSVARLGPRAQILVKLSAVAGRSLPYRVLATAAKLSRFEAVISLAELATLRGEHLLQFSGSSSSNDVAIYHDRVGTAVRSHLAPYELHELERALATALELESGRAISATAPDKGPEPSGEYHGSRSFRNESGGSGECIEMLQR